MENIVVASVIAIGLIISAYLFRDVVKYERYRIIMNSGGDSPGSITLKYDTKTGKAWHLKLPENHWIEVKDVERVDLEPKK